MIWKRRFTAAMKVADESIVGEIEYAGEAEAVRQIRMLCGEIEADATCKIDENRYVEFLPPDSVEKWKWMEEFTIEKVENPELQNKLVNALRGGKPFRRFKDVLIYHPQIEQKWFGFESSKFCDYAEKWAESEGLEIDFASKKE